LGHIYITSKLKNLGLFKAVSIDSSDVAWSRDDNSFNKVYEVDQRMVDGWIIGSRVG